MTEPDRPYDDLELLRISETTIGHYDRMAEPYWIGTRDHDVSQNHAALLETIESEPPYAILDLGCGPGRDLYYFKSAGHEAIGLEGSKELAARARHNSDARCFIRISWRSNCREPLRWCVRQCIAVPRTEPGTAAGATRAARVPKVRWCFVLFKSEGNNEEGFSGDRYSCFFDLDTWRAYVTAAGFI